MSNVTDLTMILTDWRDKERFEDLIEEHCLIRPATARNGGKCMGSYVYCMGLNYAKPELLDALLEGPWSSGSTLYLEREEWLWPLVKIFGDVPVLGWAATPEVPRV